jgi:4-hydroxy-tetrahydrodipicolinate synthase
MSSLRRALPPGSYVPLVTPFRDGEVDYDAFDRLVRRQVEGGSAGVVVTGTTGEPTSLSVAERSALYLRAVAVADGRIRVIAATGAVDQRSTLALTDGAVAAGVSAVLVVSPGFVKPSQRGLEQHFGAVAERTDLPVLLYNIPGRAAVSIEPETVVCVVERHANVIGVKHASVDLDYVTTLLLALGDDFHIYCGAESLSYPMLALGARGLMSAVGNLFPRALARLCATVADQDHVTALRLHRHLFAVNRAIFFDTNPVPLKAMLELQGLGSAEVRPPLTGLDAATHARVREVLMRYEPEPAQPALV